MKPPILYWSHSLIFQLLEIKVFVSWVNGYSFHGNAGLSMKMYSVCVCMRVCQLVLAV